MTLARDLADRFHQRWLEANPFAATMYGIPGYDDLVPDESEEGEQAWRAEVARFLREADAIAPGAAHPGRCRHARLHEGGGRPGARDHRPGAGGVHGHRHAVRRAAPPCWRVAARTVLVDAAAAEAYLTRLRRSGTWLDQIGERLRAGAGKGRLPVAPLVEQAITWAEGVLAAPVPGPVLSPRPPQGWDRAAAWEVRTPGGRRGGGQARRWRGGSPPSRSCCRGRGRPRRPGWSTCPAARKTTPGRSGSTRPCRCGRRNCTRPGWITSPRWRPGPWSWAPGWGFPGWTRCSPRCGTRPGRSRRPRPSARRRSR